MTAKTLKLSRNSHTWCICC